MNRRQRRRVEVLRSQTASNIELEFLRRYFEAVLDTLLTACATTGAWCGRGSKEFQQYRHTRQQSKKGPLPSGLLVGGLTQELEDEACWHVAKFLSDLHQTQPFGRGQPVIVEIPDHRFGLMVAVSKGPSPNALATLPFRTWDALLKEIGQTIWVDFLLWRVNLLPGPTTAREVLMGSAQALRVRLSGQQELSSEQWSLTWEQQASAATKILPARLRSMLDETLTDLTVQALGRLAGGFLRGFAERSVKRLAVVPSVQEEVLEAGLGGKLEAEHGDVTVRQIDRYLMEASSRRELEERAGKEVHTRLHGGRYDVVLLLEGAIPRDLTTSPKYGLTMTATPPAVPMLSARDRLTYACFTNIEARSTEGAINECRRRVRTALAAVATWGRTPVDIRLRSQAHFRMDGWPQWAFSGSGGTFPIGRAVEAWDKVFTTWRDLLEAEDELALRIQQALVHLNRAEGAYDAEERIEECWKILESIGGQGGGAVESWLYRLPMQFVPKTLRRMKPSNQEDFVKGRLRTLFAEFMAIKKVRNEAVVHRPIAKPDAVALERWAAIAEPRARDVLRAAVSAWYQGARAPGDIRDRLEKAYTTRFKFRLPLQGHF